MPEDAYCTACGSAIQALVAICPHCYTEQDPRNLAEAFRLLSRESAVAFLERLKTNLHLDLENPNME